MIFQVTAKTEQLSQQRQRQWQLQLLPLQKVMETTKENDIVGLGTGLRRSSRVPKETIRFDRTSYDSKPSTTDAPTTKTMSSQKAQGKEGATNPKKKAKQSVAEKEDLLKLINDKILTASLGTQGKTPEEITAIVQRHDDKIKALCGLVQRGEVLQNAVAETSTRNLLLLVHIVQDDFSFNKSKKEVIEKKGYNRKERDTVVTCIETLHSQYYGARMLKDSSTDRTPTNMRRLICKRCDNTLLEIQRRQKDGVVKWVLEKLSFGHKAMCYTGIKSLTGYALYDVDSCIIEAAREVIPLATRWYDVAKRAPQDSILQNFCKGDERFYGLFYNELAITQKGQNSLHVIELINKGFNMEEANDFNKFYSVTQATPNEKKKLMELNILFLEEFKFVKQLHAFFQNGKQYLGAVGFLAGGNKTQLLHCDVRYIEPTCNLPELPLSVLLPIGEKGRSIFFENIKDDRAKHHVNLGQAVFFYGNVPHAGAVSEAANKLDNLALHIHIDSNDFFRLPNILELVTDTVEE